ncbi:hypothetical protein LOTGIDRAFT_59142, partial [Lottia gigantea]
LSLSLLIVHVNCYGEFKDTIPNGHSVVNPCSAFGLSWSGVGHRSASGGGDLNEFGTDYDKAGRTWTQSLCMKDSDGDGYTNGQELGDPNCVWTVGQQIQAEPMGHPG